MGSRRIQKKGMNTTIQLTSEHEHDFWARVDRSEEGGCWIWTGVKNKDGYPTVAIDNDRIGAPRVSWVLHHRQPLPSYQQIRRRCKCSECVRPTHMVRANTSYSKYASRGGKTSFTLLKPPVAGKSEAPRQETVVALSGSYKELQQLRETLHVLSKALPQEYRDQKKAHEKTHTSLVELTASVDSLREEMLQWTARVDQRLRSIERTASLSLREREGQVSSNESDPAPSASSDTKSTSETERSFEETKVSSGGNGEKPRSTSAILMDAFRAEFGVPSNPDEDDYDSLDMVFDIALSESNDPSAAVERFGAWLSSFHDLTRSHPSIDSSPAEFAREVVARRLGDG